MSQVILQRAGQLACSTIRLTERKKIVQIAYTDGAVRTEPVLLVRRQEYVLFRGVIMVFFGYLLVKIRVFILDSGQGHVQFGEQVRPALIDRIIKIRFAHPAYRIHPLLRTEGVYGGIAVKLVPDKHLKGFRFTGYQWDDINHKPVFFRPFLQEALLYAALVDADSFPVEGGDILRRYFPVRRININIIGFRTHRQVREGHVRRALLSIGNVAQQVNLTVNQHLQQVRPAILHILIRPSGVCRNLLLIFVIDAFASSKLVPVAK